MRVQAFVRTQVGRVCTYNSYVCINVFSEFLPPFVSIPTNFEESYAFHMESLEVQASMIS